MDLAAHRKTLVLRPVPLEHTEIDVRDNRVTNGHPNGHASLVLRLEPLQPAPVILDLERVPADVDTALGRWGSAVAAAQDGCLVLDAAGQVVSLSATAAELLGCSDSGVIGRRLVDVTTLIDFESGAADPEYVERTPPIAVLADGGVRRSLIRVRRRDQAPATLDICGMALHDGAGEIVGSLSWLAPLPL